MKNENCIELIAPLFQSDITQKIPFLENEKNCFQAVEESMTILQTQLTLASWISCALSGTLGD